MKAIKQAATRTILDSYDKEDISYSRMNELFNELADDWAINFTEWCFENKTVDHFEDYTKAELLEIYKNERNT